MNILVPIILCIAFPVMIPVIIGVMLFASVTNALKKDGNYDEV